MQPLGHHCSAATPLTGARTCLARLARLLRAHPSLSTCEFRCPRLLSEASPDDRDSHSALPAGAFNCLNHWIVVIVELASAVVWTIRPVRTRPTSQPYLHPEQTEVDLPCTGGDSLGTARGPARLIGLHKVRSAHPSNQLEPPNPSLGGASGHTAAVGERWRAPRPASATLPGRGWGSCAMCTTLFLLSTLAMLWRRRSANRVHP